MSISTTLQCAHDNPYIYMLASGIKNVLTQRANQVLVHTGHIPVHFPYLEKRVTVSLPYHLPRHFSLASFSIFHHVVQFLPEILHKSIELLKRVMP